MSRGLKLGPVVGTFPLPSHETASGSAEWQEVVLELLADWGPGLNHVLNHIHDPSCDSKSIARLRGCYLDIHRTVCAAYGWDDLEVDLGLHQYPTGVRFGVSPGTRTELLRRLLSLNELRSSSTRGRGRPKRMRTPAIGGQLTLEDST